MIQRYSREEMSSIFTDQSRLNAWLKVELYAAEAFSKLGVIDPEDIAALWKHAGFDLERVYEIEQATRHDVVAFTRAVSETCGPEKKWIHYGLTSTDVVDTAYGYMYKQANDLIQKDCEHFMDVLKTNARKYKDVPCIGRTHGIHADITSFGLKWALWYDEFARHMERFALARKEIEVGKISGAVGNFANTDPFVQDYVCEQLGIQSSNISTQTLQRDRHAFYMATLALIASTVEKIGTEVRHLQRTEVGEAEEFFRKGQKGSSAMPHKRNPIASENMAGCARVIRGYLVPAFEDIPLWHERDISHSSAERVIFPDALTLLDYMLNRYAGVLENLLVYPEKMMADIHLTHGVIFAQRVMTQLINAGGCSREEAYDLIQPISQQSYTEQKDFNQLLKQNQDIVDRLGETGIDACFDVQYFLRNVETIFTRVGI